MDKYDCSIGRVPDVPDSIKSAICNEVEALSKDMVGSVCDIVRQRSVREAPEFGAPFGRGVKAALDKTLLLALEMGFETVDVDGYIGYACWRATTEEGGRHSRQGYVCALGHLDVVPEGSAGWKVPPYSAYLANGRITGRGVLDNKGPIYACLYALYALKRLGIEPQKEVRIIFGCDEESGFEDLHYYLARENPPVMGFTPDCKYPVVYAERGRMRVRMSAQSCGGASEEVLSGLFAFLNDCILNAKPNGERLGIDFEDEEFGVTEVRNYRLLCKGDAPAVEFDVSYPASASAGNLCTRLRSAAKTAGLSFKVLHNYPPVRFKKDCYLVRALSRAYGMVAKLDETPVTTTGGTYAKLMPNIVPFGPSFPGQKGIGHQPNEWMDVSDLVANAKIYALGLYLLSR